MNQENKPRKEVIKEVLANEQTESAAMSAPITKKKAMPSNEVMAALVGAIVGALIAATAGFITSLYNVKQQRFSEQIFLMRNLSEGFYSNELYAQIRSAIDRCETLYLGNGGPYSHDEINRYLGFFEDIGFYAIKKNFIDIDLIGHTFGAHLVEAHEYPELKKYITDLRSHQPLAFTEYEAVFKRIVASQSAYAMLAKSMETACNE